MQMFVFKNGQQLGPFDESEVSSSINSGKFSGEDLGIRQGETDWKPLNVFFPPAPPVRAPAYIATPTAAAAPVSERPTLYRKTMLQKIFFGLCFAGAGLAAIGAVVYWKMMMGPSGDPQVDLGRVAFRNLLVYSALTLFVLTAFAFFAFLLSFKRKIIRSNGLRIAMRVFFVFLLFIGIVNLGYGAFSYLNYSPSVSSSKDSGSELLKALEDGEKMAGPLMGPAIFGPIALGFILLGLSGFSMTKNSGSFDP